MCIPNIYIQYDNTYLKPAVVSVSGIFTVSLSVIYFQVDTLPNSTTACLTPRVKPKLNSTSKWKSEKCWNWTNEEPCIQTHEYAFTHTHSLCVSLPCRSWPWSTSTVTSVWTRPARRTARCPASKTAHTHAPNSGYSATSHYQKPSDHTLHTHKRTHSHTPRPRASNQGNRRVY